MSYTHTTGVPYNNRFGSSSCSGSGNGSNPAELRLQSVSEGVDMFGPTSSPRSPLEAFQGPSANLVKLQTDHSGHIHKMTSFENPVPVSAEVIDPLTHPMSPGKPRRLSRQISAADVKRQLFAGSHKVSGEAPTGQIVTSMDSGCDDVFVDVTGEMGPHPHAIILPDTSLFRSKSTVELNMSTSSSISLLPNPYNRLNHGIHSAIWCCNCFYILFFCCLPAIHYMEQSDVHYNRNNHKRAKSLGRTASFLFFTGSLIAVSVLALIFFFAIFFAVYE